MSCVDVGFEGVDSVDVKVDGTAEVDEQIEGTADSMQYFLGSVLHNNVLMSYDHESPRDQNVVGGSDGHQPQQQPASASAAASALQPA